MTPRERAEEPDVALPDYNRPVVARLVGASFHAGVHWRREGWAFMVRHDDPTHTVANGWERTRYNEAIRRINADHADVIEWVYVADLPKHSTKVNVDDPA